MPILLKLLQTIPGT